MKRGGKLFEIVWEDERESKNTIPTTFTILTIFGKISRFTNPKALRWTYLEEIININN